MRRYDFVLHWNTSFCYIELNGVQEYFMLHKERERGYCYIKRGRDVTVPQEASLFFVIPKLELRPVLWHEQLPPMLHFFWKEVVVCIRPKEKYGHRTYFNFSYLVFLPQPFLVFSFSLKTLSLLQFSEDSGECR